MLGNLGIIGEVAVNGVDRPKYGNALYGAYGQDFRCADGRRVMVIGLTERQWRGLVVATGTRKPWRRSGNGSGLDLRREGDAVPGPRRDHRHPRALVRRAPRRGHSPPAFDAAGVTWSEFRGFAQALREDPDLSPANPMFSLLDQPGIGAYPVPGSPFTFSALGREPPRPAPLLGENTEEVLADVLGLGGGEIAALMDAGVIAGPRVPEPAVSAGR